MTCRHFSSSELRQSGCCAKVLRLSRRLHATLLVDLLLFACLGRCQHGFTRLFAPYHAPCRHNIPFVFTPRDILITFSLFTVLPCWAFLLFFLGLALHVCPHVHLLDVLAHSQPWWCLLHMLLLIVLPLCLLLPFILRVVFSFAVTPRLILLLPLLVYMPPAFQILLLCGHFSLLPPLCSSCARSPLWFHASPFHCGSSASCRPGSIFSCYPSRSSWLWCPCSFSWHCRSSSCFFFLFCWVQRLPREPTHLVHFPHLLPWKGFFGPATLSSPFFVPLSSLCRSDCGHSSCIIVARGYEPPTRTMGAPMSCT